MQQEQNRNKRILKNTLLLYVRMFLLMGISLYTSRVILDKLGITDFGIYNIIGGIVAMFSFISASLQSATQRFFAYSLGQNDSTGFNKAFNSSFIIYLIVSLFLIIGVETIGLYFVYEKLNLGNTPIHRVLYVFQLSICAAVLLMLRIPFLSGITSQEKMSIFAYNSIFEAILKLLIVYLLSIGNTDKLILYSWLILGVTLIINLLYAAQCYKANKELYQLNFIIDKTFFNKILKFSGWRVLGAFSQMAEKQGSNIALNMIGGTVANAAYGLATQINVAINSLLSGFQQSFTPVLTKLYASNNEKELQKMINTSSLISFLLISFCCIPIVLNINFILKLWLVEVPLYTGAFSTLLIITVIIEAYSTPLYTVILATGSIAKYQILLSTITLLGLGLAIFFMLIGFSPIIILVPKIIISLILLILRLILVRKILLSSIKIYIQRIIIVPMFLLAIIFTGLYIVSTYVNEITMLGISIGFTIFVYPLVIYVIILNKEEKKLLLSFITKKIKNGK